MRNFFDKILFEFLRLTRPNPGLLHGLDCYKMSVTLRRGGWWRREGGASTECRHRCKQRQRPCCSPEHLSSHRRCTTGSWGLSLGHLADCQGVNTFLTPTLTDIMVVIRLTIILLPGAPAESQCQCRVLRDYELDTQSSLVSISLFSLRFSPTSSGFCSGILDSSCDAQSNSPKPVSPLIPLILPLRNTLWW